MSVNQLERPDFFEGQYLGAQDLDSLVDYVRDRHARHALGAHTWGIAMGLELTEEEAPSGDVEVYIQPGYAWDGYGRPIVVLAQYRIPKELFASCHDGDIEVWLRYDESQTKGVRPGFEVCDATDEYRRVRETFKVEIGAKTALEARQDGLSIAGMEVEDAREAFRTFVDDAPLICDGSVPHQAFSAEQENPRWLVPLGVVKWKAGSPGHFEASEEQEHKRTRILRRYIGLVAEGIHAADGVIRLRGRTTETEEGKSNDDVCEADRLAESDLTYTDGKVGVEDLVWVEGNLRVDENLKVMGNVGIGTTNPKVKLQVEGGADAELNGGGFLVIGSTRGKNIAIDNKEIMARNNGAKSTLSFQANGGDLSVHSKEAGSTRFIIEDKGNVGIGTISPNRKLQIDRDGDKTEFSLNENLFLDGAGSTVRLTNNAYRDNGSWVIKDQAKKAFTLEIRDSGKLELYGTRTNGNDDWRKLATFDAPNNKVIFPNGNVGIGTTTPDRQMHIKETTSNNANGLRIENADNTRNLRLWVGTGGAVVEAFSGTNLHLRTDGTDRLLIKNSSGNIGIGTTSPSERLDVRGNIKLGPSGNLFALGALQNLRVVIGRVNSDGSINSGVGYDVEKTDTGTYKIMFTVAFDSAPVVIVTASHPSLKDDNTANTFGIKTNEFRVAIMDINPNTNFVEEAADFDFIAIGTRS